MAQANLHVRHDFGRVKNQVEIDAISYNWEVVWKDQCIRKRVHPLEPAWPVAKRGPGKISYLAQLLDPQLQNGILKPNLSRPEITDPLYKVSDTRFGFPITYGFVFGVSRKRMPTLLGI